MKNINKLIITNKNDSKLKLYQLGGLINLDFTDAWNKDFGDTLGQAKYFGTNKNGNLTFKQKGSSSGNLSSISSTLSSINVPSLGNRGSADPTSYAIGQGIGNVVSKINPIAGTVVQAGKLVDNLMGENGWSVVNKDDAKKAGFNAGLNNILASIPGNSVYGLFMGKTKTAEKSADTESLSSLYGGSVSDIDSAINLSGKKVLWGKRKINKFIDKQNKINKKLTNINIAGNISRNNSIGDTITANNLNLYSGYSPGLSLVGERGFKFPELEEAKKLIELWNLKRSKPQKFQLGGKMNLIPEGALHARKHQLEEIDLSLEGQITKKGIPVVTKSNSGVVQMAEIEKEEWTLRKNFTDQLESLYHLYQKDNSSEAAIKAGKLICYELLKNTDDRSGLIKSIK